MSDKHPELTQQRSEAVAELTGMGRSASAIAEVLGITERSVQRYRRRLGISQRPPVPLTESQLVAAAQLLDDGCSYTEVARTIGCAGNTVARHFPGCGWTRAQINEHLRMTRRWAI